MTTTGKIHAAVIEVIDSSAALHKLVGKKTNNIYNLTAVYSRNANVKGEFYGQEPRREKTREEETSQDLEGETRRQEGEERRLVIHDLTRGRGDLR